MNKLLIFTAEFCGPCKILKEYLKDKTYNIEYVNVEDNDDLVSEYQVRSVPTQIYLDSDSNEIHRTIGYLGESGTEKEIKEYLLCEPE